ncbi:MAG: hypothetical protein F6K19_39980 [Cyanothece sp. SIO1E1]|nr:hypothetical protein [Cyanothece sp. SIO1E1]
MPNPKENINRLIGKGNIEDAIEATRNLFTEEDNSTGLQRLNLISARMSTLKKSIIEGVINQDEIGLERAKITKSLQKLIYSKTELEEPSSTRDISNYKPFLEKLINIQKETIQRFNLISVVLAIAGIVLILLPLGVLGEFGTEEGKSLVYLKTGFAIFGMTIPAWLQGLNFKRKERILKMQTFIDFITNASNLSEEVRKKIETSIIESISQGLKI